MSAIAHLIKFTLALNTKTVSTLARSIAKDRSTPDCIAVGGEDGVGKIEFTLVECLSYDKARASFECSNTLNVAERVVIGLTYLDEKRLVAVYNDFPALAFIVLG